MYVVFCNWSDLNFLFPDLKKTFDVPKEFDASSLEATQTRSSLDQIEPIASPNDDSEDSLSDSSAALEEGEIQSE